MAETTETRRAPVLRWAVVVGSGVWAILVLVIGVTTFGEANPDARLLAGSAVVLATAAAVDASRLAFRARFGWAAAALLVSVAAPTYFLWAVNAVPVVLAVGAILAAGREHQRSLPARGRETT